MQDNQLRGLNSFAGAFTSNSNSGGTSLSWAYSVIWMMLNNFFGCCIVPRSNLIQLLNRTPAVLILFQTWFMGKERNSRDQDFGGMYCAILTVNSSVVSSGVIRIFGSVVAELPLVATSNDSQGQGYFQLLFFCIENLLDSLNVRNLVLPAADEAESIWIKKFGFKKITEDQLKQYRRDYQMMVFQGTSMLHKSVSRS
ncbi:unnamed protein product [Ilex paraguariensis]|uniref:Increased DNA methylation 1 C-terminal domain-containing protein n=1 Tax=Ilex paraguariensis TaxID=185542 RepID=A0ABC8S5L8_9AQUA